MEKSTKRRINEIAFRECGRYGIIKNADDIRPEHSIRDDLGCTLAYRLIMLVSLEIEFEIEIPDEVFEAWQTMQDVYTYFEGIDYTKG